MKEAIKKAIEGGYERKNGSFSLPMKINEEYDIWEYDHNAILLDPLFWQSLGLNEKIVTLNLPELTSSVMGRPYFRKQQVATYIKKTPNRWKTEWHSFIDHLASGKDAESFFKELIK